MPSTIGQLTAPKGFGKPEQARIVCLVVPCAAIVPVAQSANQYFVRQCRRKRVIPGCRQRMIGPPPRRLLDRAEAVHRQERRAVCAVLFIVLVIGVAEKDKILVGEAVVDADVACVLLQRTSECSNPVRIHQRVDIGVGRQRSVIEQELGHGADSRRIDRVRYSVVGQRLTRPVALVVVEGSYRVVPAPLVID